MTRLIRLSMAAAAVFGLAIALSSVDATAQQKQKVSFKVDAANAKFTQQLFLDVGDIAGHQVRAYEIHRTFSTNAPAINGVKVKEAWTRGVSDYTDNNGPNFSYGVFVLENGDKFFLRTSTLAQTAGGGKLNFSSVSFITGGTGKLTGIQGVMRSNGASDPKAGFNETQYELEYWIEK